MKLNIQELRTKLENREETLVDGGYLEMDMLPLYEYYSESVDRPPRIEQYFTEHNEFKFIEFTKCYIESMVGRDVSLSYTEDEWLKIV